MLYQLWSSSLISRCILLCKWVFRCGHRVDCLKATTTATSTRTAKSNRFRLAKQQLCTCITLFYTLLCRHYMTATWKCLISRFVADVNTRQRLLFSFLELWYCVLEFNSRKICCCLSSLCTHYLTTPSRQLGEISKINLLSICAFFNLFHFCRVFHSLGRQVASWFLQVALCSYEKRIWHRLRILGRSCGSFWSLTWWCCRLSR